MKQANNVELIIWLIVAVVGVAAKGLGKLSTPAGDEDTPPVAKPKPPVRRPPVRRPMPPPVATVTVRRAVERSVSPPVVTEAPVQKPSPEKPAAAVVPVPARAKISESPSVRRQWALALRDRQNVRNAVIVNEIIGAPVSLRSQ